MNKNSPVIDALDRSFARDGTPQSIGLASLIRSARTAMGDSAHYPAGADTPTGVIRQEAAVVGEFKLSDQRPAPTGDLARSLSTLNTQRATYPIQSTMLSRVLEASRVVQAGVTMVPIPPAPQAVYFQKAGALGFPEYPSRFEVVKPGTFAVVADGANAPVSVFPVSTAQIDLSATPSMAVSFKMTRAQQKARQDSDIEFYISESIALGLARACDAAVLAAILAKSPSAFTLAKAAAAGLKFGELRAICGTNATGAAVAADGTLRVSNIQAEMTDTITASVVACFGRIGVAFDETVRVVARRMSIAGDLEVTCYCTLAPLIPTNDAWLGA